MRRRGRLRLCGGRRSALRRELCGRRRFSGRARRGAHRARRRGRGVDLSRSQLHGGGSWHVLVGRRRRCLRRGGWRGRSARLPRRTARHARRPLAARQLDHAGLERSLRHTLDAARRAADRHADRKLKPVGAPADVRTDVCAICVADAEAYADAQPAPDPAAHAGPDARAGKSYGGTGLRADSKTNASAVLGADDEAYAPPVSTPPTPMPSLVPTPRPTLFPRASPRASPRGSPRGSRPWAPESRSAASKACEARRAALRRTAATARRTGPRRTTRSRPQVRCGANGARACSSRTTSLSSAPRSRAVAQV